MSQIHVKGYEPIKSKDHKKQKAHMLLEGKFVATNQIKAIHVKAKEPMKSLQFKLKQSM